ncbi:MAG: type II toxin-antitoxin system HicA family toxin [Prevotellaceae bacterium]|jgi:predicted RNA binding protein YcfA (HicA-like mRNA interferase family)|nr:type II toxin-antitoxin system HicA family toxin [Prevotellaceae bacterium]
MSTKEKLIARFKTLPKDFTFDELVRLLTALGFEVSNKGKTSGSRVRFQNQKSKVIIDIHRPHTSGAAIKETTLKEINDNLITNNLIKDE